MIANALNIEFVLLDEFKNVRDFLIHINKRGAERVHLVTVTSDFKAFFNHDFEAAKVYFHFHNVDLWFKPAFKLQFQRLKEVYFEKQIKVKWWRQLKYSAKDVFNDFYRKK